MAADQALGMCTAAVQNGKNMRLNELFPGRWLSAGDLDGDTPATIAYVTPRERVGDDERPVVAFQETRVKPLVLNKTNALAIAKVAGTDDLEKWPGTRIVLFPTFTQFGAEQRPCIRVREHRPKQAGNIGRGTQQRRPDHQAPLPVDAPPADDGQWEREPF